MLARELDAAREAYARQRWQQAYEAYHAAVEDGSEDRASGVEALVLEDLIALADAAWWVGRTDESLRLSERAFRLLLADGQEEAAARVALEAGFLWLLRGELTVGSGWMARARRLLAEREETAAHGLLGYVEVETALGDGDLDRARATAGWIQALADRLEDPTLVAIGLVLEGRILALDGAVAEGLRVIDEAMLPVRAGEVEPSWAGNLYCQVMSLCFGLGDLQRARAWTEATERWCDRQTNAAMFVGICRVHRAQLLHLEGAWDEAEREATTACQDLADMNVEVVAAGRYELGELHRRRGDLEAAEAAYAEAEACGRDPQPGRALLRLAQGNAEAATAALRAALAVRTLPTERAPLLSALVEVAWVGEDRELAVPTADELVAIADRVGTAGLVATARVAAGTAYLVEQEPGRAVPLLRDGVRRWRSLQASFEVAHARLRLAVALDRVGDVEAGTRERHAGEAALEALGVRAADVAARPTPGGLTPRELEVLTCIARGRSNRATADRLFISERTVERHLSNIYLKLGVASRTEAAAFAFTQGLIEASSGPG